MDGTTQRAAMAAGAGSDHESASMMTAAPTPAKAGGWKVESVNIRAATNGGFIVSCSKKRELPPGKEDGNGPMGQTYKSDDLAFGTLDEMLGYVTSEFGGGALPASGPMIAADEDPAGQGDEDMSGAGSGY